MKKVKVTAIVLAAGSGTRMMSSLTKQRMMICGESVLHRSVRVISDCDLVDSIVVAVREDEIEYAKSELIDDFPKINKIVSGGKSRAESAKLAFKEIDPDTDYVAIHDAARCLVTKEIIADVICSAEKYGAATAGSRVTDTVKLIDGCGSVESTLPRENLFFASTPQVFSVNLYKKALDSVEDINCITDDNMLIEKIGGKIYAVDVGSENIKITTMADIEYAEFLLSKRSNKKMEQIRVGHGYDVHRLVEGRDLIIGGVKIPYEKGLLGHSDADVLTHAVMDALLGAASLGDIGRHFPDSDAEYRGISSISLLQRVNKLLQDNGFSVVNIDVTVVMQKPKIASYVEEMVFNISSALGIDRTSVNIKATTEEKLGFTGSGEGVSAHAVALIKK